MSYSSYSATHGFVRPRALARCCALRQRPTATGSLQASSPTNHSDHVLHPLSRWVLTRSLRPGLSRSTKDQVLSQKVLIASLPPDYGIILCHTHCTHVWISRQLASSQQEQPPVALSHCAATATVQRSDSRAQIVGASADCAGSRTLEL